ncbi:MAG: hypothetical protein K6G24_12595 [Lachnospiraceae bacterium]|nr:hypothetical protein [Lachnospiraceae bacterium]
MKNSILKNIERKTPLREKTLLPGIILVGLSLIILLLEAIIGLKTDLFFFPMLIFIPGCILLFVFIVSLLFKKIVKKKGKRFLGIVYNRRYVFDFMSFSRAAQNLKFLVMYNNGEKYTTPVYSRNIMRYRFCDKCIIYVWGPLKYVDFEEELK